MYKKLSALLISIIIIISAPINAFSASETKALFTLDKKYNMAVSVLFDKEKPTISFIAPDGSVINGTSLRSDSGDDWIQYYIPNAASGQWKITYDKKSNSKFEVNYSSYMETIEISDFTFDAVKDKSIPVKFIVNGKSTDTYKWEIYAVITDSNNSVTGERLLTSGSEKLGESISRDIYIGDLSDYSNYQLRLDVWQKYGVEEAFDSRIASGSFAVSGNVSGNSIDDFRVELNITDGDLIIDWSEWSRYGDYLVGVFNDDISKTEPIYSEEITDGRNRIEALFDPECNSLRIELTEIKSGNNSPVKSKSIPINNGVKISTPSNGLTNSSQMLIEYEVPRTMDAEVIVNDKSEIKKLNGNGNFSVNLSDSYNNIEIRYSLSDENVIYIARFEVNVDSVPPMLRLPENKSAIRVDSDSYTLAGVTEADCVLKIGEDTPSINGDGSFVHTVNLKNGENIIKITATDMAGNITVQDIVITKVSNVYTASANTDDGFWNKVLKFLPMIISFAVSIFLLFTILFISKGFGKTNNKKLFILRTIRNIAVTVGTICLVADVFYLFRYIHLNKRSNSEEYFELALRSIDEAYIFLQDAQFSLQMLKLCSILFACCLTITVIAIIMIKQTVKLNDEDLKKPADTMATNISIEEEAKIEVVENTAPSKAINEYICPSCNAKHNTKTNFCEKCGSKM